MMAITAAEKNLPAAPAEVDSAKCECCGLTEDCTPAYIAGVRERHHGRWICGLCSEAVKDEISRAGRLISTEEALDRHTSFSRDFRRPIDSAHYLIAAMRQLLRRSLSSERTLRSTPASPRTSSAEEEGAGGVARPVLARSGSCFPTIAS